MAALSHKRDGDGDSAQPKHQSGRLAVETSGGSLPLRRGHAVRAVQVGCEAETAGGSGRCVAVTWVAALLL